MTTSMLDLRILQGSAENTMIMAGLDDGDRLRDADPSIGERQLGRFILPPFQRPPAWDRPRQVKLIESLWLGLPIAAYVYNQPSFFSAQGLRTDMWLIDGQQRWTAIHDYVAGRFEAFGRRYPDLSVREQRAFRQMTFPSIVLKSNDPVMLKDIYERLAYGGVAHEPEPEPEGSASFGPR